MFGKGKAFWESLDRDYVVNGQKLFVGMALCTLAGMLLGSVLNSSVEITVDDGDELPEAEPVEEVPAEE